jgi:hypothetical protein
MTDASITSYPIFRGKPLKIIANLGPNAATRTIDAASTTTLCGSKSSYLSTRNYKQPPGRSGVGWRTCICHRWLPETKLSA